MEKGTWKDVTGECTLNWPFGTGAGKWLELHHGGIARVLLGPNGIDQFHPSGEYRIVENLGDSRYACGTFRIEQFIPDPEPVIAYKAVRVDGDGVFRSVLIGSGKEHMLGGKNLPPHCEYVIGKRTDGGKNGVFCFATLEQAKSIYIDRGYLRSARPLAILEVEAIGEAFIPDTSTTLPTGNVNYPSVKVLSVAWEEEKKEEWVDVTAECTFTLSSRWGAQDLRWINMCHDDKEILLFGGDRPTPYGVGKDSKQYRITYGHKGYDGIMFACGGIKVEKRNG